MNRIARLHMLAAIAAVGALPASVTRRLPEPEPPPQPPVPDEIRTRAERRRIERAEAKRKRKAARRAR